MSDAYFEMDIGNRVLCDACNKDYTDSDARGGILFGSKAICPECTPRWLHDARAYGEESHVRNQAMPGEMFREFVLRIRDGNNKVSVRGSESEVKIMRSIFEGMHKS